MFYRNYITALLCRRLSVVFALFVIDTSKVLIDCMFQQGGRGLIFAEFFLGTRSWLHAHLISIHHHNSIRSISPRNGILEIPYRDEKTKASTVK